MAKEWYWSRRALRESHLCSIHFPTTSTSSRAPMECPAGPPPLHRLCLSAAALSNMTETTMMGNYKTARVVSSVRLHESAHSAMPHKYSAATERFLQLFPRVLTVVGAGIVSYQCH